MNKKKTCREYEAEQTSNVSDFFCIHLNQPLSEDMTLLLCIAFVMWFYASIISHV